jgi:endonuclease YncB( thermonuclease family)
MKSVIIPVMVGNDLLAADATSRNAELAGHGLAMAVIYRPEDRYNLLLSRLQEEAKSFNHGIWKYAVSAEDESEKPIVGNRRAKVYHLPEGRYYNLI